ncbi:MAG TPA: hypothetical protein EYP14_14655, partial [Planctomycetaceae bacterium]|nr:hypothetical protein [Planctomycetaceae bacterium]
MDLYRLGITSALLVFISTAVCFGQYRPLPGATERPRRMHGTILDFTGNRHPRNRLFCPSLGRYRDVYVYLPPGYTPEHTYPLLIWLHGFSTDERVFACHLVPIVDELIATGRIPPLIAVGPDGSVRSRFPLVRAGSWYVNSRHGRFGDYICKDIVEFVERNFSVAAHPAARAVAGFSMGGFGAFCLGME